MGNLSHADFEKVKIVGMSPEQRALECMSVIRVALERYTCVIVPMLHIEADQINSGYRVAALQMKGGELPIINPPTPTKR